MPRRKTTTKKIPRLTSVEKASRIKDQLDAVNEIAKFKLENEGGKYPPQSSKLGKKLSTLRTAAQGKGTGKLYPESRDLAIKLGFPVMFDLAGVDISRVGVRVEINGSQ